MNSTEPARNVIAPRMRKTLLTFGIMAIVLGLAPSWSYTGGQVSTNAERDFLLKNPSEMPFRSEMKFGLPFSPVLRRFSERSLSNDAKMGILVRNSQGAAFDLVSWSMASIAAGFCFMWAAGRFEKPKADAGPG